MTDKPPHGGDHEPPEGEPPGLGGSQVNEAYFLHL